MLATYLTARQVGERLNLEHLEVIRRIRKGQIPAKKFGWNWVIDAEDVEEVKQADWYTRLMSLRERRAAS